MSHAESESVTAETLIQDFVKSGRTGRRNAMPDILDEGKVNLSTADLPGGLDGLDLSSGQSHSSSDSKNKATDTVKS